MQKNQPNIEIVDYDESISEAIQTLNYEWLEKYFTVEEGDRMSLQNPKKYILDQGGFIYYVKVNDEIIGTASLLKVDEHTYELGKMAVTEGFQGSGIGSVLLKYCIDQAKEKNIKALILYSNTKLASAIHLYTKYGFVEVELESGKYNRADIKMKKYL